MEISNAFVCIMGIGTTFIGLTCIIVVCKIMGWICNKAESKKKPDEEIQYEGNTEEIPNRQEMLAAISAVAAEEMGTEVSAIRILSLKKL